MSSCGVRDEGLGLAVPKSSALRVSGEGCRRDGGAGTRCARKTPTVFQLTSSATASGLASTGSNSGAFVAFITASPSTSSLGR